MFQATVFCSGPDKGEPGARKRHFAAASADTVEGALEAVAGVLLRGEGSGGALSPAGLDVEEDGVLVLTAYGDTIAEAVGEAVAMQRKAARGGGR